MDLILALDYATTFTEDAGPRLIISSTLTVSDTDSATIHSAIVTLTNRPDGNEEILEFDGTLTNIIANYDPSSGELNLSSIETIADYQTALRTITYNNTSDAPETTDRLVTFQVYDGANYSELVTSTVAINAVNDAPMLDNLGDMRLSAIDEDAKNQIGSLVKSIIEAAEIGGQDRITDPDTRINAISLEGIAVTEVGASNGDWQYSTDAGTSWRDFGVVTNNLATLLDVAARVRFLPHHNYYGPASITFRAWDQTNGSNGETGVDVSVNGGSSAFSIATETAPIDVIAVNDPPVLDLNGTISGTNFVANYAVASGPVPVVASDATITDFDNNEIVSAQITLTTRPDGGSELLAINGDASPLTVIPYNPASGELRLTGAASLDVYTSVLRNITYDNLTLNPNMENRIIEFVINDGLDDSQISTTTLLVGPFNDAPTLELPDNTTAVFREDNGPVIVAGSGLNVSDVDSLILKSASVNIENHQANTADILATTINYSSISVSYDGTAGILSLTGNGTIAEYQAVLRAVTFENHSHDPNIHDRIVALVVNDGVASSNIVTSTVKVESINDLPVIDLNGGENPGINVIVQFGKPYWNGNPLLISKDVEILDLDSSSLTSATVTLSNQPDGQFEHLAVDTTGTNITDNYDQQIGQLQLTGMESLANFIQVLSTITYANQLELPHTEDRLVEFVVYDHEGASKTATSRVVITPKFIFLPTVAAHPIELPESDEPNNSCEQAFPIANNVSHEFLPDDKDDWYSFALDKPGDVIVQVTNFMPLDGQILVAQGQCGTLTRIGHNGDYTVDKTVSLGRLLAGRYFIWLITDEVPPPGAIVPYNLTVQVN